MVTSLRIVALGDSLTAGFGVREQESYPSLLEAALIGRGIDCRVQNAGVSGDTCRNVLARLPQVTAASPDLVILEIGLNDILMGAMPERIETNLTSIVQRLQESGIRVALAGMVLPPMGDPAEESAFAAVYPSVASALGLELIPEFNAPVWQGDGREQFDGIHPTADGYAAITHHILPGVIQALEPLLSAGKSVR